MKTKIRRQVLVRMKRKCLKFMKMKNSSVHCVPKSWGQKPLSKDTCLKFMRKKSHFNVFNVQQGLVLKVNSIDILTKFMEEVDLIVSMNTKDTCIMSMRKTSHFNAFLVQLGLLLKMI